MNKLEETSEYLQQIIDNLAKLAEVVGGVGISFKDKPEPDYKNWVRKVPEEYIEYYFPKPVALNSFYKTSQTKWVNDIEDQTRLYFTNRDDCKLAVEILNRQRRLIGDWKPDWGNQTIDKAYISWNYVTEQPIAGWYSNIQGQGLVYMPPRAAEKIIEEYGDKLAVILK